VKTNSFDAYLLSLLARREYSRFELSNKLYQKGASDIEIESLLTKFEKAGFQSDKRFAECFFRYQVSKLRGPVRILSEMKVKGISKDIYENLIQRSDIDWHEVLIKAYIKKFKTEPIVITDYKLKTKKVNYLLAQGFSLDSIIGILS
jgi:regulatory protein